jgi:predicted GNAT superfamily acetyltransferase
LRRRLSVIAIGEAPVTTRLLRAADFQILRSSMLWRADIDPLILPRHGRDLDDRYSARESHRILLPRRKLWREMPIDAAAARPPSRDIDDRAILPITPSLLPSVLALNSAYAVELSWLEADELETLLQTAYLTLRIGSVDAFLIAFHETSTYDSPNFRWFQARYRRFAYIDRVVVVPECRGRGYASRLYCRVFAAAARSGRRIVACEVNSDPPNPESDRFHASLGFVQVGKARSEHNGKSVRYMARLISPRDLRWQEMVL